MTLLERIAELAEPLRAPTFVKAAEFILTLDNPIIVETGCFRGCTGDGQSTLILALLAKEKNGELLSFELNIGHIEEAEKHLGELGYIVCFVQGDSADTLTRYSPDGIHFAYLDSYDFEEHKALDAQNHQVKEVQILLPKMAQHSAILIDDCDLPLGGKGGLSIPLIIKAGYKETATAYQRFFER